jgi:2-polyprenyl-3-methyl-5-hydroxy-6-metoxy-1,4-benzoquinol methylase
VFSFLRPRAATPTGRPTESSYGRAGPLVRCASCGLVRQDPRADVRYEDAVDPDYLAEREGLRAQSASIVETIERFRPPGTLLDIGCGPGILVEVAASRGWNAIGIELSAWAVNEARSRGLDVRQRRLEELDLPPACVDAVVIADVIEHVPDPADVMRRAFSLLTPGGVVFLATPDVDSLVARALRRWWWSVLPGHIWLFSRTTLSRLVRDAGFEIAQISTHPKTFSVAYYAGRLGGYASIAGRAARRIAGSARLVTPDFHDRVAIVAQKPTL